ncbi:hypothetical protein P8452_20443 [Trifolium repens]|nr:hypothetical protein P8452_20443 [Trifolium repens]
MKHCRTMIRLRRFMDSNTIIRGQGFRIRACDCTQPREKEMLLRHSVRGVKYLKKEKSTEIQVVAADSSSSKSAAVLDSDHHQLVKCSTSTTTTAAKKHVKRPKLGIIKCPLGNTKRNKKNKN